MNVPRTVPRARLTAMNRTDRVPGPWPQEPSSPAQGDRHEGAETSKQAGRVWPRCVSRWVKQGEAWPLHP